MKGSIETSSTIGLPILKESPTPILIPFGSRTLEDFIKKDLLSCIKFCKIGNNLVDTVNNQYSVTLDENKEVILVVDIGSIEYYIGCGEVCLAWQPKITKQQYRYEHQIAEIMYKNYGINLDDFTKLVHERFITVPYHDITTTYERISAKKLYHVIETDNFDRDYPNEHFVSFIDHEGNSRPLVFDKKEDAQVIAKAFNQIKYGGSNRYFMEVDKARKLLGPFEP